MIDKEFSKVVHNRIKKLHSVNGVTMADTERILDAVFDTIYSECASDGDVRVAGFGKFEPIVRQARKGRNPSTGEIMNHPEHYSIKFSMFGKTRFRYEDDYKNKDYVNSNLEYLKADDEND